MKRLKKPNIDVSDVIKACVSNYRDKDKADRFRSSLQEIYDYSEIFDEKMKQEVVYEIEPHNLVKDVSKDELVSLYAQKFVQDGQPGRIFYDKIISSSNGKCPICEIRTVTTLDHFLVKSIYPALAVTPTNLVPMCHDCNKAKGDPVFTCYEDTHLHPYYDSLDDFVWLEADISFDKEIIILYKVRECSEWSDSYYTKVRNHFDLFGIRMILSLQAVDEIKSVKKMLSNLKNKAGNDIVYEQLEDLYLSCEAESLNGWKTALYRNICKNKWFVEEYL